MNERTELLGSAREMRNADARLAGEQGLEDALHAVWKQVFQTDKVDREANFFEMGGNSMLGMELADLLATQLAIDVPVVMVFQYPSIRELAAAISSLEHESDR